MYRTLRYGLRGERRVGGVGVAGVQFDEPVQGGDRFVVFISLVMGVGGHQLGLGRPDRIGVLALNLVEFGRRRFIISPQGIGHGLVVEGFDRTCLNLVHQYLARLVGAPDQGEANQRAGENKTLSGHQALDRTVSA